VHEDREDDGVLFCGASISQTALGTAARSRSWSTASEDQRVVLTAVFDGLNRDLGNFTGRCERCGCGRQTSSAGVDDRLSGVAHDGKPEHRSTEGKHVKAVLHSRYGTPDLLQFKEIDKPEPKDNEVLIAIRATTVSTGDCNMRNFTFVTKSMLPFAKLAFGIGKPWKERILGTELAGEAEARW